MNDNAIRHDVSLLTPQDLHLFNEGTQYRGYRLLGSHVVESHGRQGTHFGVWAPNAESVSVMGDFNGWNPDSHPLRPTGSSGIWEGFVPGVRQGTIYKYRVRGRTAGYSAEKADPYAIHAENAPRTGSIVWDLVYSWNDQEWMQTRGARNSLQAPMSIYEVHLGSWMRAAEDGNRHLSYREVAPKLADYCHHMGFTHVELLPIMEHPFYGSWGYQTTGYFAPTSRFGTPQDFMFLVDHLHQRGIGVILDWVPSHFPTDGHGLSYFDGTHLYEHEDPRQGFHQDWKSSIFNYGRHEVRSFLMSSAFYWLDVYHVDGLRVDAVASMLYLDYSRKEGEWIPNEHGGRENLEAIDFLRHFNEAIFREHPEVQTIAEESTSWPMVSRPLYVGGLGFGLKWDMGWMHDTLEYMAEDPIHRKYHHNKITFRMLYAWHENFVLPLSHDEVVHGKGSLLNKMSGEGWEEFANLRAAARLHVRPVGQEAPLHGGRDRAARRVEPRGEPRLAPPRAREPPRSAEVGPGPQPPLPRRARAPRAGLRPGRLRVGGLQRHRAEPPRLPPPGPIDGGPRAGGLQLHPGPEAELPARSASPGVLEGGPEQRLEGVLGRGTRKPRRGGVGSLRGPRPSPLPHRDPAAPGRGVLQARGRAGHGGAGGGSGGGEAVSAAEGAVAEGKRVAPKKAAKARPAVATKTTPKRGKKKAADGESAA